MALGDIKISRPSTELKIVQRAVKAGAIASIEAGEPVIVDGSNAGYVKKPAADVDTDFVLVGFAVTTSTDVVATDGVVYVAMPDPGTIFRGKAKTPGSLAQAKVDTNVTIDLTSDVFTIDESTTTKGMCHIVGFNSTTGTVDFTVKQSAAAGA